MSSDNGTTLDDGLTIMNTTTGIESHDWVTIVDSVILSATIIGALMILVSMGILEYRGRPATTRMRIVQSLVVSDLVMGITGLTSVALEMAGKLTEGQACDGLGTLFVAVIWSEHLWTLSLALGTFMILIHPLHTLTLVLEKKWYFLWLFVWVFSFGMSVMGYKLYGYTPNGGICYYPSTSGLFGELMAFIPRAIVFLIITILYAKLFVFLRRPDKIRSPYSNSPAGSDPGHGGQSSFLGISSRRAPAILSSLFRKALPKDFTKEHVIERKVSIAGGVPMPVDPTADEATPQDVPANHPWSTTNSAMVSPTSEIPPWEKMELPTFQVDGQRFGGAAANAGTGGSSTPIWSNWKGLSGSTRADGRKRPSTASSYSPPPQSARKFGSGSSMIIPEIITDRHNTSPTSPPRHRLESIPSGEDALTFQNMAQHQTIDRGLGGRVAPRGSVTSSYAERIRQSSTLVGDTAFLGKPDDGHVRRSSAATDASRGSSTNLAAMQTTQARSSVADSYGQFDGRRGSRQDPETGDEAEDDDDWDLMRVLAQTQPPKSADDRFAPREGETIELVEESMASYLNRKTALLMLWFPLGYILLFSISLIRIIYDFVGRPPTALRAISRWFIFAQGVLDALIYGLVEWHTKRVVRRRVKKGTFSPNNSRGMGTSSWPKNLLSRRSGPTSQTPDHGTPQLSATGARSGPLRSSFFSRSNRQAGQPHQSQSVSFGGRFGERSIMQALELDPITGEALVPPLPAGEDRRGSEGVNSVASKATGETTLTSQLMESKVEQKL